MALIINGRKPTGCFDCDYCDKRAYFDGNEWHLGCRLLCMEVSEDGETDERCPIIAEIPDRHGRLIDADALEGILDEVNRYGDASEITYKKMIEILHDEILAPVIVEATE